MDDPSLLLSNTYQQKLLALIQEWQQQGAAVFFASNNVDHLMAVADRILVLHNGRCTGEHRTDAATREDILAAAEANATPALSAGLQTARASVRELVSDLRLICGALRPPTIDNLGWTRRCNLTRTNGASGTASN